jgi:hypothetical protein
MSLEGALIKFIAREDRQSYFASLSTERGSVPKLPTVGSISQAYISLEDLLEKRSVRHVTVERVRTTDFRCYAMANHFDTVSCSTP